MLWVKVLLSSCSAGFQSPRNFKSSYFTYWCLWLLREMFSYFISGQWDRRRKTLPKKEEHSNKTLTENFTLHYKLWLHSTLKTVFFGPGVYILGLVEPLEARRATITLLGLLLFYARKAIALQWKAQAPPTLDKWKSLINSVHPILKLHITGGHAFLSLKRFDLLSWQLCTLQSYLESPSP